MPLDIGIPSPSKLYSPFPHEYKKKVEEEKNRKEEEEEEEKAREKKKKKKREKKQQQQQKRGQSPKFSVALFVRKEGGSRRQTNYFPAAYRSDCHVQSARPCE